MEQGYVDFEAANKEGTNFFLGACMNRYLPIVDVNAVNRNGQWTLRLERVEEGKDEKNFFFNWKIAYALKNDHSVSFNSNLCPTEIRQRELKVKVALSWFVK